MSRNQQAVCYVTDINFLLPSIISASGIRKYVAADKADIFIFLTDSDNELISRLNAELSSTNISIVGIDNHLFQEINLEKFKKSHVPLAAIGRFFLDGFLPDSCKNLVYIDGDTWVKRDPTALILATVPEGHFAAAEDTVFMRQKNNFLASGKDIRNYFQSLGVDLKNGYFNSGVFAVSRKTWKTVAREAYQYLKDNTVICRYHDQSALNAIMGDRRLRLSAKWNFQTPYRYLDVEKDLNPCIYHFNQSPKAWMGKCEPWIDVYDDYMSALTPFKHLGLPIKTADDSTIAQHNAKIQKKFILLKYPFLPQIMKCLIGYYGLEQKAWM